jgi:ABC-type uncharacterized transport system involved in gliding motility auxiliary subunit
MLDWVRNANRTTIATITVVLAIILFLSINLIASLTIFGNRLDVTEDRIYTLTDETRDILADITEPITLRLYLSSSLVNASPEIRLHSERVIELLKTYENVSGGMIDFQQFDPVSLSVEEDEALGLDIAPIQISVNDRAYFGLVATNTLDDIEIIPFFEPQQTAALEYDLTRIVSRLSNRDFPIVGIISGLSLEEDGGGPVQLIRRLEEEFIVEQLPPDTNIIPPYIDALLIIHPYVLFHPTRYAVDQYVIRGGKALLLLDMMAEQGPPNPENATLLRFPSSYFEPVLASWGVQMAPDLVVGDPETARLVQSVDGRQFPWLERFDATGFNPDDIVTAPLSEVLFLSPGALAPAAGATTEFTPLITTSDQAGFVPLSTAMVRQPPRSAQEFVPVGEQVLAARITGIVQTAYPDGPPEQAEGITTLPPDLIAESVGPIDVIVVADTDLISDESLVGQTFGLSNVEFVVNAVEQLAGAANLTTLRGRETVPRPFVTIQTLMADANQEYGPTIEALTEEYNNLNLAINDLLSRNPFGQPTALPADQRAQYDEMLARQLQVQRERRDLEALVRNEFENLRARLIRNNILIVPLVVIAFGLILAAWRRARLARYVRSRRAAA